jgi:hypothetical protein
MNPSLRLPVLALAALLSLSAGAASPHAHHHDAGSLKLSLNAGQKWKTDAPLRKGMSVIKQAIETREARLHGGKMTAAEFATLGKEIDQAVQGIFAACRLPPAADQNLHLVLVQIMNGSRVLEDPKADHLQGVREITGALAAYGEHFDHPGWTPLKH